MDSPLWDHVYNHIGLSLPGLRQGLWLNPRKGQVSSTSFTPPQVYLLGDSVARQVWPRGRRLTSPPNSYSKGSCSALGVVGWIKQGPLIPIFPTYRPKASLQVQWTNNFGYSPHPSHNMRLFLRSSHCLAINSWPKPLAPNCRGERKKKKADHRTQKSEAFSIGADSKRGRRK